MTNAFQSLGFQHNFGFQGGTGVTPTPSGRLKPAGKAAKKDRRRKALVEIDGETFTVWSEAEAQALLARAQELAQERAQVAAKSALNKARKTRRKTGAERLPTLEIAVPEIRLVSGHADTDMSALVAAAQQAMDTIYLRAAQAAEFAYLAHREWMLDVDDDEAMDVLLRHE